MSVRKLLSNTFFGPYSPKKHWRSSEMLLFLTPIALVRKELIHILKTHGLMMFPTTRKLNLLCSGCGKLQVVLTFEVVLSKTLEPDSLCDRRFTQKNR